MVTQSLTHRTLLYTANALKLSHGRTAGVDLLLQQQDSSIDDDDDDKELLTASIRGRSANL